MADIDRFLFYTLPILPAFLLSNKVYRSMTGTIGYHSGQVLEKYYLPIMLFFLIFNDFKSDIPNIFIKFLIWWLLSPKISFFIRAYVILEIEKVVEWLIPVLGGSLNEGRASVEQQLDNFTKRYVRLSLAGEDPMARKNGFGYLYNQESFLAFLIRFGVTYGLYVSGISAIAYYPFELFKKLKFV
jgi:hypothetical protein